MDTEAGHARWLARIGDTLVNQVWPDGSIHARPSWVKPNTRRRRRMRKRGHQEWQVDPTVGYDDIITEYGSRNPEEVYEQESIERFQGVHPGQADFPPLDTFASYAPPVGQLVPGVSSSSSDYVPLSAAFDYNIPVATREFVPDIQDVEMLQDLHSGYRPEETKHRDFAPASRSANLAGEIILMNGMASGSSVTTRVGRRCRILSFLLRGSIRPTVTECSWHRSDLYVIWDNEPGAALPVAADLLEDATSVGQTNWANRTRFTTLVHRYWMFDPMSVVATSSYCGNVTAPLEVYKKVDREMQFKTDNTGVNSVADISCGALYYFVVGDSDTNFSKFTISMRLLYEE